MTYQEQKFQIGEASVTRLTEIVFDSFAPDFLLPDWHEDAVAPHWEWMEGKAVKPDGSALIVNINTWVVQTRKALVVIDTGIGDGRVRRIEPFNELRTGYLERLATAGFDPAAVTHVLCTHVHSDHVGWNTKLVDGRWVPTFPNARYHWSHSENETASGEEFRNSLAAGVYEDSVAPIIKAGLLDLVDDAGGEVIEGFTFYPTPGHTPGHMSISLRSGGAEALFSGDVVHCPIQVCRPEWNSAFCEDQERARQSRRWALNYAADRQALFLPAHFGGSSAGYVTREGAGFRWAFA